MDNQKLQRDVKELEARVTKLQSDFNNLSQAFYKNNFSSSQVFNKDCVFSTRLQVPVYSSAPSISEVGDLIAVAGQLYICTVANTTFELVGTQS